MRRTKKVIYAEQGIEYRSKDGRIYCDLLNTWIKPVLKVGNDKVGKQVRTFSIGAGNKAIDNEVMEKVLENVREQYTNVSADVLRMMCGGTCNCNCKGCYAQTGCYQFFSVKMCIARHTFLTRTAAGIDWLRRAIIAQIEADKIKKIRIHAAGDFVSAEYVNMWTAIMVAFPDVIAWTYTKRTFDEIEVFESLNNVNIVDSMWNGKINYGTCGHIISLYHEMKAAGLDPWICKCGLDKTLPENEQVHCSNCGHCFTHDYVLFLEHSTDYEPENDPLYPEFLKLVASQPESVAA